MQTKEILEVSKIIPVITIYDLKTSVDLAKALIEGGIKILEITLRTQEAIEAIKLISKEIPEAVVGAGTVLNTKMLEEVKNAGAKFAISPGLNVVFAKEARNIDLPLIPGIATAGELMLALEFGFKNLKFFPAQAAGGINMLKSFSAPFQEIKFCPTGGISLDNMNDYLKLDNVLCVGGSWLTPKELILDKKWNQITQIAKQSLGQIL
ncbi:bifunctional 4-hydroxy-2-oxoglutarate aldolase/2-dehydro-3-deoxy-phosphogluconate aldolase [Campylobacter sp. LH-2024]|uniref:Bifunctional 4-hydroxy-2-oxoglutarate aldolase/2-dehydro-3-deoxy-phosphogluconate aldolase n=1 Tax=Campylobacter molothri TaxID=1032242 RepID=A0ACC5W2L2_9BACT|nr:bifunctional 4-hydroxy-2-oxoglutarate aldolase/2-dehydro-3-deoxy-phosphogluconate aldolase [Campylobacter sp. RM10537]MBZ7929143.1 bifunctional 4-hydroxy-2-oxoglutarate aldolase/2-dehydro-3-deoxy-phosphogluconate aldolase [Campylobacter sp. RM10542]MBZ7933523.1 bifunctional 4-hydroxy-2-oxoglutarate aldolase/2-dehydro-3-deoxy-phosphogluconate aldolase [Campylobacter sp. RM10543]MBZ7941286.1 bifunctional 4-hydroxy-2-oxoglutarate aldolase/2-dehydro-3-deoxy-phosphogluconate aldolase [Campylobacte